MENITNKQLIKYQVTISFEMDEQFLSLVPAHRVFINNLITQHVIDTYAVSIESKRGWITINAINKADAKKILSESPLFSYWVLEIDEIFVYDGQIYRLPDLQFN